MAADCIEALTFFGFRHVHRWEVILIGLLGKAEKETWKTRAMCSWSRKQLVHDFRSGLPWLGLWPVAKIWSGLKFTAAP